MRDRSLMDTATLDLAVRSTQKRDGSNEQPVRSTKKLL